MRLVSIPTKAIATPVRWGINRLDTHLFVIMITAIGIFYQIEQTTGDLRLAIGFGLIPGVMWILGARFVANRQDPSGQDTSDSNAK